MPALAPVIRTVGIVYLSISKVAPRPTETQQDTQHFDVLRGLEFFRDFEDIELWEVLRLSKWRKFPPDTVLIKEGDRGEDDGDDAKA